MMTTVVAAHARTIITEILKNVDLTEAAALYGSVARGDVEPHSDIDLLVLCRSGQKRALLDAVHPSLSDKFKRLSLAIYTHEEIEFLERSGSLFLLHLKREAEILFERSDFLSTVLSDFRAKPSYRADLAESFALLDPLRTRVAHSPNDLHRLSYVYSLFRVFGVYLLAEKGIYEFSKAKMAASLVQEYPNADQSVAALSGLRVLNANFFSGGEHRIATSKYTLTDALAVYISALSQLTGETICLCERPYDAAIQEFVAEANAVEGLNYRFRTWFLLLGVRPKIDFLRTDPTREVIHMGLSGTVGVV